MRQLIKKLNMANTNETKRLIEWLNDECPYGTMTNDLSHDFADILRTKLDSINLALGKPEPLAKNKQTQEVCYMCDSDNGTPYIFCEKHYNEYMEWSANQADANSR